MNTLQLLEDWRNGDESAAAAIFHRFSESLCRLAEREVGTRLRARLDPDDIVQSALVSFFRRTQEGQYRFDHSGELWRLLVKITKRKVLGKVEYHVQAQRRSVKLEANRVEDLAPDVFVAEPTAEEAVILADELESLCQSLNDVQAEILALSLQGFSTQEIGEQLGCTRWTVRRNLDRIDHLLRQSLEERSED